MYGYLEEECPWQSEQSGQRPQGGSFPAMLKGRYWKTACGPNLAHQLFLSIKLLTHSCACCLHITYGFMVLQHQSGIVGIET